MNSDDFRPLGVPIVHEVRLAGYTLEATWIEYIPIEK